MDTSILSPIVRDLLTPDRLCQLGPGTANEAMRAKLKKLTPANLFAPAQVRRPDFASACLAGLWLYHDFLSESHTLSQNISSAEGSYWHAIMHRREPDYANAAYWFRQVGPHQVFGGLGQEVRDLAKADVHGIAVPLTWDPFWFIDFCEACVRKKQPGEKLARLIQKREWELLFEYCYRKAKE